MSQAKTVNTQSATGNYRKLGRFNLKYLNQMNKKRMKIEEDEDFFKLNNCHVCIGLNLNVIAIVLIHNEGVGYLNI